LAGLAPNDHADQLGNRARARLGHDVRAVCFDGALADAEVGRDAFVAFAADNGIENILFARGQQALPIGTADDRQCRSGDGRRRGGARRGRVRSTVGH
jgi:hypothetical protein